MRLSVNHLFFAVVTIYSINNAFAEDIVGVKTATNSTKVQACADAKKSAIAEMDYNYNMQTANDKVFSRPSKPAKERIQGCDCEASGSGYICSAEWTIKYE